MASEIKVATISEKTSAGGVTIDGLLIKDGGISGDVSLIGTTPTFTIGDAGAEDAALVFDGNAKDFYIALDDSADKLVIGEGSTVGTNSILTITDDTVTIGDAAAVDTAIVFDGNAQDYYIALDDSADDLLIGKGSTVGTTPAISIDSDLKVNIPVTTASTSASTGSLITGGGMGVGADLYVGDDTYLITDSAVLGFGADKDTLLTHTDGTGLTLNSTNKLCFNDTSQFIQGISATVLGLGATDEIDLTATTVDLNGTLNVSGIATFQAAPVFPDGSLALADLDIDGGTDIGADIVDADLFIIDDGAGGTNRKTVASRLKTYIGGGIDCDADAWARIAPTTDQDSAAVIDWATSVHLGSNITESGGVITVGTAGWYLVCFHISNASAYADNMDMHLRKNDSNQLGMIYWQGNTEINYLGMEATVLIECSADDTLDVYGTGYYAGDTVAATSVSWFTGVRLGA